MGFWFRGSVLGGQTSVAAVALKLPPTKSKPGLRFRVQGLGIRDYGCPGLVYRVQGLGFRVLCTLPMGQSSSEFCRFRFCWSVGCRVWGVGCRV